MRSFVTVGILASVLGAAEPPKLKLGDDIRPVKYAAELTLVPGASTFAGRIDIDVLLAKPSSLIWLNASDLSIQEASATAGGKSAPATVEPGNEDFVGLHPAAEIPAGPATIHIRYQGKISPKNSAGVFQGKDGGETYLYTQFEPTDARHAFPCFDQPDLKAAWQLTLHVRASDRAFSNSPQLSETPEADGMKKVVFAQTKPLSSYLVAAAVGPFEIVDAGHAGRNKVAVRIIVPKGKTAWAAYAAQVTPVIVQKLEDYFGIPFPFEKVDNVAIAVNAGFAMENAGMVTYDQTIILNDPATDTINRQRGYASVAAHELAHQWFGDLVTTAWWDDIWLNEAFATWTSSRILATWKPEWNTRLSDLGSKFGAMGDDSLISARQIRQPIESQDDISNAFDGITYEKGAAVIRMFESWMGEAAFQKGIHSYLTRYAYKNARVNDFLDAVGGAGKPGLGQAFSTFLDQPGFPEVSAELECSGPPKVKLSQSRYLPIGSAGTGQPVWRTPVCVRYPNASGSQSECFLLTGASAEFPLSTANACPAYLFANADAAGYYSSVYGGDGLAKLAEHASSLTAAEKESMLHDLAMAADAGHLKPSAALSTAEPFAGAPERQIVGEVQGLVASGRTSLPPELAPNYARYVNKLFGARAEKLGWTARPGDSDDTRLERSSLVPFVARWGGNAALAAEARHLADGWLKDRKGVDNDMLSAVLTTAARTGGQDLFDRMHTALKENKNPRQRQVLLGAMGSFRDPKIIDEALGMVLDPELDTRETFGLLFGPLGDQRTRAIPLQYLKAHYDAVVARFPNAAGMDYRAMLPFLGNGACDDASRKDFVDFFQDRVKDYVGGPRNYAQVLESTRLCQAHRAAWGADLAAFYARQ